MKASIFANGILANGMQATKKMADITMSEFASFRSLALAGIVGRNSEIFSVCLCVICFTNLLD